MKSQSVLRRVLGVVGLLGSAVWPGALQGEEVVASASQTQEKKAEIAAQAEAQAPFVELKTGQAGLAENGVAFFYVEGMTDATAPLSPALLERPRIQEELPSAWATRPVFATNGQYFRATVRTEAGTDFYGGGEVTGPLRRNGRSIKVWNTDNFGYYKDKGQRLYQAHPWMMGVRPDGTAFGVLFDSTWKAELACSETEIAFTAHGPAFPVMVIEKDSPQEVLKALGKWTGTMELPPLWALGYQQCRWSYTPDTRVKEIADEFRKRRIPCDVIWMDIDYMEGYRVFTFHKDRFPDPRGLNEYLHDRGFKAVWMIDPGIKVDKKYNVYMDGRSQDVYVKTADGAEFHGDVWPGPCAFPDFTRPETRQWWADLFPAYMATGIDGVWNDMNEPAVFKGIDGTMPEDNHHRGGEEFPAGSHRQYHNIYGMQMTRATRAGILKANPDKRPFVLTRANFIGGQRYAATWTGDNTSNENDMKLSVPMTLTLSLSGQPFNGPDLGGFAGEAKPELWGQWVGFGNFFPFARGHAVSNSKPKEPWAFGVEVEHTARLALERRYRLLPYFYTLFHESTQTGLPVMRPMFLANAQDPSLRKEQAAFLLGKDLIIVPSWAKNLALPKGEWPVVSLADGDLADAHQATVRLRPGAIVPLGKVIQNTTQYSVEDLTLLVCLDETGRAEGTLYEDAGDGFAYRQGDYALTRFEARLEDGQVVVRIADTQGQRKSGIKNVEVKVAGTPGGSGKFVGKTN